MPQLYVDSVVLQQQQNKIKTQTKPVNPLLGRTKIKTKQKYDKIEERKCRQLETECFYPRSFKNPDTITCWFTQWIFAAPNKHRVEVKTHCLAFTKMGKTGLCDLFVLCRLRSCLCPETLVALDCHSLDVLLWVQVMFDKECVCITLAESLL